MQVNRISLADELKDLDFDQAREALRARMAYYPRSLQSVRRRRIAFYRAVDATLLPLSIDQLWYPPPDKSPIGRVNRPAKPMFYCSNAEIAVLAEKRVQAGKRYAISTWSLQHDFDAVRIGYSRHRFAEWGTSFLPDLQPLADHISTQQDWVEIERAFTQKADNFPDLHYKISIALSEIMIGPNAFGISPIGFMYPSVEMRGQAENFALRPGIVRTHLNLELVKWVSVLEASHETSSYRVREERLGIGNGIGQIVWKDAPKTPTEYSVTLTDQGWQVTCHQGEFQTWLPLLPQRPGGGLGLPG